MSNTFSWSCASCGEYNVVDLRDQSRTQMRCEFCFRSARPTPDLHAERHEEHRVILSDDWLGDEIIRPLFGDAARDRT